MGSAEQDLEEIKEKETVERILNKIGEIEKMIEMGIDPTTAVEKRLKGEWSPILQQRVGDHRIWFVEGSKTERGKDHIFYLVRVLSKHDQEKLMGVDINPEAYL